MKLGSAPSTPWSAESNGPLTVRAPRNSVCLHSLLPTSLRLTLPLVGGCPWPALRVPHVLAHLHSPAPLFPRWAPHSAKGNLPPAKRPTCISTALQTLPPSLPTLTLHPLKGSGQSPSPLIQDTTHMHAGNPAQSFPLMSPESLSACGLRCLCWAQGSWLEGAATWWKRNTLSLSLCAPPLSAPPRNSAQSLQSVRTEASEPSGSRQATLAPTSSLSPRGRPNPQKGKGRLRQPLTPSSSSITR